MADPVYTLKWLHTKNAHELRKQEHFGFLLHICQCSDHGMDGFGKKSQQRWQWWRWQQRHQLDIFTIYNFMLRRNVQTYAFIAALNDAIENFLVNASAPAPPNPNEYGNFGMSLVFQIYSSHILTFSQNYFQKHRISLRPTLLSRESVPALALDVLLILMFCVIW